MRIGVLVIALIFMLNEWAGHRYSALISMPAQNAALKAQNVLVSSTGMPPLLASTNSVSAVRDSDVRVDFETQIKPILQSRCLPCHFSGGVMYERLPFDRADTIKKLGTKLFTRIEDENHRRLIRDFLEQE
jgi:hypothetical protein